MVRKGFSQLFNRKPSNSKPLIAEITPRAAIPEGEVMICGSGFASGNHHRPQISFGDVDAQLVVSSDNFLVARVPEGATSGQVTIRTGFGSSDPYEFEVGVAIAENLHPVANPALDEEGNVFVTFSGARGQKVPVSIYKIDLNYAAKPFVTDIMNSSGLAFDRAGQLYVSSRHEGVVYRVAPNGTFSLYVEGMGVATGLAFDPEENLYVGDRSGTIFKISRDRQIFVFATLEPSVAAYHLAFGLDRCLYVSGPTISSFDCVHRISPSGQVEVFYRGLGRPQGVAFDVQGNLYVAASLGGRKGIVRIAPDRRAQLVISGSGLVGLAFTAGRSLILASTNSAFHLNWDIRGLPLLSSNRDG